MYLLEIRWGLLDKWINLMVFISYYITVLELQHVHILYTIIREWIWSHAKENHEWCLKVSVTQMHRSQSPFSTTGATNTLQCTWFVFSSHVNYLFTWLSFHFPQYTSLSWQSWVSLSNDRYIQPGQKRKGHKRIKVNIMPLLGPVNWYLKFPSKVQTLSMLHQSWGFWVWTSPASTAGVY